MKNILVTGGAGYIGSHTVTELIDHGYNVVVADDLSSGSKAAIDSRAKFYELDVTNQEEFSQIFQNETIDAVLHCAGKIIVGESMEKPLEYYEANVTGLGNVLEILVKYKVDKIMFSSTASVYGNNCFDSKATEETSVAAINPYAETKYAGERLIHWTAFRNNMRYVIFRYFNVAGASLDASNGLRVKNPTHIIPNANKTILGENDVLQIFGQDYDTEDGTCIRDYIHVLDLARAHVMGMDYLFDGHPSDLFNIGTEKGFSVTEIAKAVEKVTNTKLNFIYVGRREGDPASVLADCTKVRNKLRWEPKYTLDDIILSDYNWRKK
ncbi:UDP-glucose 4-epimerase GalE [Bacillus sp. CDB3]|uniref:UDP-glucose 4-epimerase GalE n=1 Tax=Bacillus sp. CDB3 TaxID=360310 RepID=UPI0009D81F35|nr:UDP-glucose 4-epimerase GalE [Bacillus sp. CDB3]OQR57321.1 UDP-glucose 4-epimerase GalE [Bacillus sp. CDB3]